MFHGNGIKWEGEVGDIGDYFEAQRLADWRLVPQGMCFKMDMQLWE